MKLHKSHKNKFVTLQSKRWGAIVSGVYLGVMDDEGEAYHFFRGGVVGVTPQIHPNGIEGYHGFPVSHTDDHEILEVK